MNSLWIALAGVGALALGYRFYGRFMTRLWQVDPHQPPPAKTRFDGVDYVPARHWTILFGHHFASIAGAGPILGPVLAVAAWGWAPALLWIVLGTIFIGAVHDFSALMVSLRQGGRSVSEVSQRVMGKNARILFAAFLWLTLVLVVAVFAAATANTLVESPEVVLPTLGLILTALGAGYWLNRRGGSQFVVTAVALALLALFLILGRAFPLALPGEAGVRIWIGLLLGYALVASILPVDLLLQPRDYLSTFILFLGLGAGYLGLALTRYPVEAPALAAAAPAQGPLWPMLFVFVACGAVSGFHSLVSSGTTSKQLACKGDALRVGYGAMVLEAALALLALLAVGAGLYWRGGPGREGLVLPELLAGGDWIGTFGRGFGRITEPLFGPVLGASLAVLMLNAFVMTTLDSATRITRYLTEELFGEALGWRWFKGRLPASLLAVGAAAVLAFGPWQTLWPLFGAANQLVAALTLLVVTFYLLDRGRPTGYTLLPALFMLVTTVAALLYQAWRFAAAGRWALAAMALVLVGLAGFMLEAARRGWRRRACAAHGAEGEKA